MTISQTTVSMALADAPISIPPMAARFGASDLSVFGEYLLVPFEARRFGQARIVWRNPRWLLENGVDILDPNEIQALDQWLVERFAFGVPCRHDPKSTFATDAPITLHADRYGGPSGSLHGGSGRCGFRDGYLIKGVGRTPLVAPGADFSHSNGFLPLSEAIHEAIGAEICHAEGPNQAVPILAIIATGARCYDEAGRPGEERALSIRPSFVRIAHLQRSIFFGQSGWAGSDQDLDGKRTADVVRAVWPADVTQQARPGPYSISSGPSETLDRLARQYAFSRVQRLWPSTFSASNFTVNGASLDHGSFKATQDWTSAEETPGLPRFGSEARSLGSLAKSLAFCCQKYLGTIQDPQALGRTALRRLELAFQDEICLALGLPLDTPAPVKQVLHTPFARLWAKQQRVESFLGDPGRRDWIYTYLQDPSLSLRSVQRPESWHAAQEWRETLNRLRIDGSLTSNQALAVEAAARRFCRPRPELYHHHLRGRARRLSRRVDQNVQSAQTLVDDFINRTLTAGRRLWRRMPAFFTVESQATSPYWSILRGYDGEHRRAAVWIEATVVGERAFVFGQAVSLKAFSSIEAVGPHRQASCVFEIHGQSSSSLRLPTGEDLLLPPMVEIYRAPGMGAAEEHRWMGG